MDTLCKTFPRCPLVVVLGPPAEQSTLRHIYVKLLQSLQKYRQTIGGKTQKGDLADPIVFRDCGFPVYASWLSDVHPALYE